jgi:hypothetical protein
MNALPIRRVALAVLLASGCRASADSSVPDPSGDDSAPVGDTSPPDSGTDTGTDLGVSLLTDAPEQYRTLELEFVSPVTVDNPDDPDQIDVAATFRSPDGDAWTVPGFFYQGYERVDAEILPVGDATWRVRFAPPLSGAWTVEVSVRIPTESWSEVLADTIEVAPATTRGFVRRSDANPRALEFADGSPLLPIGFNASFWYEHKTTLGETLPNTRGTVVEDYLADIAAGGGNFARVLLFTWFNAIENPVDPVTGYEGVGRYHGLSAWEIDQIVAVAEEQGITLLFAIDDANATVNLANGMESDPAYAAWVPYNPYAAGNGGPLEDMSTFWTDATARALYQRKLRYVMARWGSSRAMGLVELFAEVRLDAGADAATIDAWVAEMADYVHTLDPYDRPLTMSSHSFTVKGWYEDWLTTWDHLDVVQYHMYESENLEQSMYEWNEALLGGLGKPILVGEYGSLEDADGKHYDDVTADRTGIQLHNALWSSVFTGAAGALPWYTFYYVDPLDLYTTAAGLRAFSEGWAINDAPWTSVVITTETMSPDRDADRWIDLDLASSDLWMRRETDTYSVTSDGRLGGALYVNSFLWAPDWHPDYRRPPSFDLTYGTDGQFVLNVDYVWGTDGTTMPLSVTLDGAEVERIELPIGEGAGSSSTWYGDYGLWLVEYDTSYAVPVPAGAHTLGVDIGENDSMRATFTLVDYVDANLVTPYRAYGLTDGTDVYLWLQNTGHTFSNAYTGTLPTTWTPAWINVPVARDGTYEVEWWDTYAGEVVYTASQASEAGVVRIYWNGHYADLGLKVRLVSEAL